MERTLSILLKQNTKEEWILEDWDLQVSEKNGPLDDGIVFLISYISILIILLYNLN